MWHNSILQYIQLYNNDEDQEDQIYFTMFDRGREQETLQRTTKG